jgi:hypothetical protein
MKIEIVDGCFGYTILVDSNHLFDYSYDDYIIDENIASKLPDNLVKDVKDMSEYEIATYIRNNYELKETTDKYVCDTCGDWNKTDVYILKNK